MKTVCRHCDPFPLPTTYASMLIDKGEAGLRETMDALEQRLIPCVTAVCPKCDQVSIVSTGSVDSVLRTVVMWRCLKEWIDRDGEAGDYRDETTDLPKQKAEKNSPIAHRGA
jgi:hypothetical protein